MNLMNTLPISNNRQNTITEGLSTPRLFKHPNTTKALNIASKLLLVSITGMVLITILFLVCHHHTLQYLKHNIINIHNFIDIMFITISISIVINIIIMSLYLWNKRSSVRVTTLPNENNIHNHQQVLFDKLYKNAMAITIRQQKHVLALHKKREPEEKQLDVENTFNELIELLTIDVNTDKIKHLFLYKDIDDILLVNIHGLSHITTRMYLWLFQQRFLDLYNNHRVINNEYIQQCYKDDHLIN